MPLLPSKNGPAITTPDASADMISERTCHTKERKSHTMVKVDPVRKSCICKGRLETQPASQKPTPSVEKSIEARLQRPTVTRSLLAPLDPILEDTRISIQSLGSRKEKSEFLAPPPSSDINKVSPYSDSGTLSAPALNGPKDLTGQS